jgi:hypothetical protein
LTKDPLSLATDLVVKRAALKAIGLLEHHGVGVISMKLQIEARQI